MITIPTGDLTGILADVVPFAHPDEDLADLNAVWVAWDGEMLHAYSHDLSRTAWSQWSPDDPLPPGTVDILGADWGSADEPWSIGLRLADAREIVSVFKLPTKERACPLTVQLTDCRLRVARSRETSRSALIGVWEDASLERWDVRAYLSQWDRIRPVKSIAFNASMLADFEIPRQRGPLRLTFTGHETPTLVEIGERFLGAVTPTQTERRINLRTASGLVTGRETDD